MSEWPDRSEQPSRWPLSLGPVVGQRLAAALQATRADEIACDDVFRLLDVCVEAAARGEDISNLMPLVDHHLQNCPECREEYEALLRAVQAERPSAVG